MDAAADRQQMGHEAERNPVLTGGEREFLLDFRGVAVSRQPVGGHAFVAFREQMGLRQLASGAAEAAGRADDEACGVDEPFAQQWHQRQDHAGRVAAGAGDQARGGQLVAVDFGHAVDRLGQQSGRGMRLAVGGGVDRRVAQPEVGAQVDDAQAGIEQWQREFMRQSVWQGEEGDVAAGTGDRGDVGLAELQPGCGAHPSDDFAQRASGVLARGHAGELDPRVSREDCDQLLARVSVGTDHGDIDPVH